MLEVVSRQAERVDALARYLEKTNSGSELVEILLYPVVLTVYEPSNRLVEGCPVVPIHTLTSFLASAAYAAGLRGIKARVSPNWLSRLEGRHAKLIS